MNLLIKAPHLNLGGKWPPAKEIRANKLTLKKHLSMKLKNADYTALKKAQASAVITSKAEVNLQQQIVLAGKTDPMTGVVMPIGKTKSGNFAYVMTTKQGSFKFYSTEELDSDLLEDAIFGEQVLPDGKSLFWLNRD